MKSRCLVGMMFFAAAILPRSAAASSALTTLAQANAAYNASNYPAAIAQYEDLLARGHASGWIYYNLGNSYLRNGQLGRSIAAYLRAEAQLPRHQDIAHNLEFARAQTHDALLPIEPSPLARLVFFWHYTLSYHELVYVVALCNFLLWAALSLWVLRRQTPFWRYASYTLATMLVASALSCAIHSLWPTQTLIVDKPRIEVHSGTSYDTVVRFMLHEGTQGRVLDVQDGWIRLEIADGKQGWVSSGDVIRLSLP